MKPFLDTGFLLTLLSKTSGSDQAWEIARSVDGPLLLGSFQVFHIENQLQRRMEDKESSDLVRAVAAATLQRLKWYVEQQVFQTMPIDYEIAIQLASQWQKR
jgi:hypothetical protein